MAKLIEISLKNGHAWYHKTCPYDSDVTQLFH